MAAKIKMGVGSPAKMDATKSSEGGLDSAEKSSVHKNSADNILARAKELAGDNPTVLAMIRDVEGMKSRGRSNGAVDGHEDLVKPGATDEYTIKFDGKREAQILVSGDGDTDLDLFVYDEGDHLICEDTDSTDTMYCSWTPAWTGKYTVKIQNFGRVSNVYELYTN
jgi:hypothetical protein